MAHPDIDELLNALLPFAQKMLAEHGEFHPFGASMARDGQVVVAAGYTEDERPPSQQVVEVLVSGFRERALAAEITAAGVCVRVEVPQPHGAGSTPAVCVQLEHRDAEPVDVMLPYKKRMFGRIKYGDLFAGPGERRVFDSPAP